MAPPQPCYTSVPPRVVSDSSSSNMSISAPYFFESNNNKDAAVEKYEVLSDISADDHQHIFMEEDEEPPVVVLSRTQVVGVGGNNCNNNPDEVFSLSFALPPKEKSSASSACMSVDEVLPTDPPLQTRNHHHHHARPSSNEQQLEVLVHPVTPTYERKKHLFQDQHQHQHQCCEHHEDHTKCVFRCCHGSSAAPAQCPAQVPLPSFGSNASYTRNHYDDHNRRNCSDKDQAIYETKTTDFPVAPRVSRTTFSNVRRLSKSSRSRIREDYYYSSSNSHASTSIPRCVYVTSDVGSHHHGSASRHRRTMSSSTCVSISTMENIDDEGWDANKRRMFFDQQRREQAKSVVAQEIRYYVGQLSPFPKRKLNRNVELKRCNGCLA
eukprot:CAMPEP_0116015490 /NCGR_PEP_ID=MMETSP0321-20121206/6877_1 /TAXON_ID=163516 /ORGANISM="Leptocylindrus danicus var. danicus, Strain B650" /LENGTH=379 /DNA_ID=CAMNT_0003485289 /DNA_START=358 /DNA_END=1497 /DNA_ORIENTATION=+